MSSFVKISRKCHWNSGFIFHAVIPMQWLQLG
uniref:Uncharacterized protein n=1 Tax=Setaria viridis TaxID=4556 RepID=A0A4U6VI01_SETVI|nr:hypothetical protein SEVIR_3G011950v2 [Setaria viridis]